MTATAIRHEFGTSQPRIARPPVNGATDTRATARYLVSPRLVAAALAVAGMLLLATAVQADQPHAVSEYVVAGGDTLWGIAEQVTPAGDDLRATLATVRRLNDLASSTIHPGQVLLLPAG